MTLLPNADSMELFLLTVAFAWAFRLAYAGTVSFCYPRVRTPGGAPALCCRLVSCLHAGALVALGLAQCAAPPCQWWPLLARAVPVGYLVHDFHLIWTEPSIWGRPIAVHHVVFALLVSFAAESFPDHTARAFLAETSVFFLNAGWVMIRTGWRERAPRLFAANVAVLFLTFLRFRVYTFTSLALESIALEKWALLPLVAGIAGLNWYWFALMCRAVYRAGEARKGL
jgi:hypothetical protein